jgi:hypothetical protein
VSISTNPQFDTCRSIFEIEAPKLQALKFQALKFQALKFQALKFQALKFQALKSEDPASQPPRYGGSEISSLRSQATPAKCI